MILKSLTIVLLVMIISHKGNRKRHEQRTNLNVRHITSTVV